MSRRVVYRKLRASDMDHVEQLYIYEYLMDEPLVNMLDLEIPRDVQPIVDMILSRVLDDNLSYVATDSDNVIGMRLCVTSSKDKPFTFDITESDENRRLARLRTVIDRLYEGVDVFSYFNAQEVVLFKGMCVKEAYREVGIGQRLVRLTLEECGRRGFGAVVGATANDAARAIFKKFGFKTLRTINIKDMEIEGRPVASDIGENGWFTLHGLKLVD